MFPDAAVSGEHGSVLVDPCTLQSLDPSNIPDTKEGTVFGAIKNARGKEGGVCELSALLHCLALRLGRRTS